MKITIALNEIDADQAIAKEMVETACEITGRPYDYNGDEVTIGNCLYGNQERQKFIYFAKSTKSNMNTIVIAATRSDGCVGYFKTLADVPKEFKYPGEENIAGIMKSMRLTDVDACLKTMNSHWQK